MKFKTTLILLAAFVALLAFVLFFESRNKGKKETEEKLVDVPSADVEKMTLKKEDGTIAFRKDDQGNWLITEPLEAQADSSEVNRLAEDFSSLRIERVVEKQGGDLAKYEIPKEELTLWYKNRPEPEKILIGMENPLDKALFAKKEGDPRIVLIPSYLKSQLDKTTFDYRQKEVFKYEPADVTSIRLRAKDVTWEARKKEEGWFFLKPFNALAKKSQIEDILRTLADLKAKEFVSEARNEKDMARYGLKDPEYVISLALPSKNQDVTFFLHKDGDNVYATTSLSSKILNVDGQVLANLEKKAEDLREKQVVTFNSWEAQKLQLIAGSLNLEVSKDADGKWSFDDAAKEEADKPKIETFLRQIETLEASEFIDSPASLEVYGLAQPQAEITVWTKEDETEKQSQLFVGTEDKEKKQVVVRNPKFPYLFRVDSSFLAEFPKEAKDWKVETPAEKKEEKK
jgi:hypothetical protein